MRFKNSYISDLRIGITAFAWRSNVRDLYCLNIFTFWNNLESTKPYLFLLFEIKLHEKKIIGSVLNSINSSLLAYFVWIYIECAISTNNWNKSYSTMKCFIWCSPNNNTWAVIIQIEISSNTSDGIISESGIRFQTVNLWIHDKLMANYRPRTLRCVLNSRW